MARVEIKGLAVGVVQDRNGNVRSGIVFTCSSTVYAASTGATALTGGQLVSNEFGELPGWLAAGVHTITIPAFSKSVTFEVGDDGIINGEARLSAVEGGQFAGLAIEAAELFSDDFNRATINPAPDGSTYGIAGSGAGTAAISDGRFVATGTVYLTKMFAARPLSIGGEISFTEPTPGGASYGYAVAMSSDPTFTADNMIHLTGDHDSARLTTWRPGFQDVEMASGQSNITFATPLPRDGTPIAVSMMISGDTVIVEWSNGERLVASDPLVSDLAGPLCFWEIIPFSAPNPVRWDSFVATAVSTANIGIPLTAAAINGPLGVEEPSSVIATDLHLKAGGGHIGALIEALTTGFMSRIRFKTVTGPSIPEIRSDSGASNLAFYTGVTPARRMNIPQSGGGVFFDEFLDFLHYASTPATPAAGRSRLYPDSTGVWKTRGPDGVVLPLTKGAELNAPGIMPGEKQLITGKWVGLPAVTSAVAAPAVNQAFLTPFWVPRSQAFDRIGLFVTTAVAASTIRLGVYADNNGVPGALITDYGTVDTTTTGAKEITIALTQGPALLWLCAASQGGTPTVLALNLALCPSTSPSPQTSWVITAVSGALPASASGAAVGGTAHRVALRVA